MVSVIDIGEIFLACAGAGFRCQMYLACSAQPGVAFSPVGRPGEAGDRYPFEP